MLATAAEENLGYGGTIRLLKNNCQPARYFTTDGWRFVTDEEISKVLTIERIYLGPRRPKRKIGKKRRYGK